MTNFIIERPSWDETWLAVACDIAKRSLCVRDQVGAVIVSPQQRVIATGYNGPPAGFCHNEQPCSDWCQRAALAKEVMTTGLLPIMPDYSDCPALHAEANALSVCERSVREGGTIYITSNICWNCAKLVANSGLKRVVVLVKAEFAHRNSDKSYEFLEQCGLKVDLT